MARKDVDLYNIGEDPADVAAALIRLRQDFDAHNHDGSSSLPLGNVFAQSIQAQYAIIGGHRLFEAVVGVNKSDYKTVAEALNAGKTRIFVRNGTYNSEPKWAITNANTSIVGESLGGVQITFAQDVANSRSIYVNALRSRFENLKLTSYEAAEQDLFQFGSSGARPIIENCMVRNKGGKFFNGSSLANLYGTFRNIYLDLTATEDVTKMIGFSTVSHSEAYNIFFDLTGLANSGCKIVNGCDDTKFFGGAMISDQINNIPVINSITSRFFGTYLYFHEISPIAVFNGCYFKNNGNAPSGYFLDVNEAGARITNSFIELTNSDNLLRCSSAHLVFSNNRITGGKEILIQNADVVIKGGVINGNIWVSPYNTAAMDLELGANAYNWLVVNNVIRNNSAGATATPTITDGGTGNTVANNQLILA